MKLSSGNYVIAGVGETPVGKLPNEDIVSLSLKAAKAAIEDAGLKKSEVDGLLTVKTRNATFLWSIGLCEALGISPSFTTDLDLGGATPIAMVAHAIGAIEMGLCRNVVCVFGDDRRTGGRHHGQLHRGTEDTEDPFGFLGAPGGYAMIARRHMHEYGTRPEQLGAVAVAMRKHASLNENAQMREPITLEDYMASRLIVDPLRLLDCCLVSDGAGAVVVTRRDQARDLAKPPVSVLGLAEFHPHRFLSNAPSLTTSGASVAGKRAFGQAGISPEEIDVAEIYDCFTIMVIIQLEDYGFCRKGEGGAFAEGGHIELGGKLPVNTHGGLLSQGHVDGMLHITEAVKQLRGECGKRQVRDAKLALVSGNGGIMSTHASLILGR